MKKMLMLVLALVFLLSVTGCTCSHEWEHATGGHGQYCEDCGAYETLEEPCQYKPGTYRDCENPRKCIHCGKPETEAKKHNWVYSDGDSPAVCMVCGMVAF